MCWILCRFNLKIKGRPKISDQEMDPNLDSLMKSKFADAVKVNKTYTDLICNL